MYLRTILENSAEKYSDREAVRKDGASITYSDLIVAARSIADVLGSCVQPGSRVAIYLDKSIEFVESIFAIAEAGCTYVPLDTNSPPERNRYIVHDCQINTIICLKSKDHDAGKLAKNNLLVEHIILIDEETKNAYAKNIKCNNGQEPGTLSDSNKSNTEEDVAAILYTSGTTGTPKGVMITNANIQVFIAWVIETFHVTENDRLISHAPFNFDLSLLDLFAAIATGACVVLVPYHKTAIPKYLIKLIATEKITIWQSVPAALIIMAEFGDFHSHDLDCLRLVLFAGEKMPVKYLKKIILHANNLDLYNIYGSTETNDSFMHKVDKSATMDPLPIGSKLPYVDYVILDNQQKKVDSPGLAGELFVRSPTTMSGYWNSPDKNKESFVYIDGNYYYKTNDLVEIREDGELNLIGRVDDIVKCSGHRVNLLEIENNIMQNEDIISAAVIAIPDDMIGNKIVAFVIVRDNAKLSIIDLKINCSNTLPKYMIPNSFQICNRKFKKTSSGKIDKQYLKQIVQHT